MSSIKIDSKEKTEQVRHFLLELKRMQGIEPFLVIEDIQKYGIYDFCYVNMRSTSFDIIQKKLKEQQYSCFRDLVDDVKLIFVTVSDYVFMGEELQLVCEKFIKIVCEFEKEFIKNFEGIAPAPSKPKTKTIKQKREQEEIKEQSEKTPSQNMNNEQVIDLQTTEKEREIASDMSRLELADRLEMLYFCRDKNQNKTALKLMTSYFGIGHQKGGDFFINIDTNSEFWNFYSPRNNK